MKVQSKRLSWLVAVMLLVSSCASSPDGSDGDSANGGTSSVYEGGGLNSASTGDFYNDSEYGKNVIAGPKSPAKDRVIYFSYDSSSFDPRAEPIIAAHANYLVKNPNARILIEGHTDERGSREYNIALGERRATTVLKELVKRGVSAKQLRVISYGEESPADSGHDENAYTKNRRAVIQY